MLAEVDPECFSPAIGKRSIRAVADAPVRSRQIVLKIHRFCEFRNLSIAGCNGDRQLIPRGADRQLTKSSVSQQLPYSANIQCGREILPLTHRHLDPGVDRLGDGWWELGGPGCNCYWEFGAPSCGKTIYGRVRESRSPGNAIPGSFPDSFLSLRQSPPHDRRLQSDRPSRDRTQSWLSLL